VSILRLGKQRAAFGRGIFADNEGPHLVPFFSPGSSLSDSFAEISDVGFLLIDEDLSPVVFNAEAVRILAYPSNPETLRDSAALLVDKIRGSLVALREQPYPLVSEFKSGKRRYLCRAFLMDPYGERPSEPSAALLLERYLSGPTPLHRISEFQFTPRQREAIELLMHGLTNKQIADRMAISLHTVKSLFRLVMLKLGVTSRVEIVARIIEGETACPRA
jgi:DNA-binding CsgD family transcriptional regulator